MTLTATTVKEATEAETRVLMAQRAALPVTWQTRAERAELLGEIDGLLEVWLEL